MHQEIKTSLGIRFVDPYFGQLKARCACFLSKIDFLSS